MEIEEFCPRCDELIKVNISDDYYMEPEGKEMDIDEDCPQCGQELTVSWCMNHTHDLHKKEEKRGEE